MSVKNTSKKSLSKLSDKSSLTTKAITKPATNPLNRSSLKSSLSLQEAKAFLKIETQPFTLITKKPSKRKKSMVEDKAK